MGLFDSVWVPCPHCGELVEFQSKVREDMRNYCLDNAPADILRDVMNQPEHCRRCDGWMTLFDPRFPPGVEQPPPDLRPVKVRKPSNPHTHPQGMKWWPDGQPFTLDDIELDGGTP